jgi:FtsP/CotA-like multicopper oxidase with cupredoxin domain
VIHLLGAARACRGAGSARQDALIARFAIPPAASAHTLAPESGPARSLHDFGLMTDAPGSRPSRRQLIEGAVAAGAWLGAACSRRSLPRVFAATPRSGSSAAPPVALEVALRAGPAEAVLDPTGRRATQIWRFEGTRLSGKPEALLTSPESYLGPMFRVRRGQRIRVHFENALDEPSIVHWHGLQVSAENDGHPRLAIGPGATYDYDFTVENRPGLYWYHPHPDRRTGPQVYAGMAGLFLVEDPDDAARGLPTGELDLALLIQDRLLGADGELVYAPNQMVGFLGDRIFVNGRQAPTLTVEGASYRLRILNGSNSRVYKLAFSDDSPMTVIGSDGGLLGAPVRKPYVVLAPGERVELWVDFGRSPTGQEVWLESRAFAGSGGMMGMGGGMMGMGGGMMGMGQRGGASGLANGAPFRVCRFRVRGVGRRLSPPARFEPLDWRPDSEVVNRGRPRRFDVSMAMMRWQFNGRSFDMTEVAEDERVKLGATEDWEFRNLGGMMAMAHPIHLHGGQFQVLEREVAAQWQSVAETLRAGLVDEGWKDTFLLLPGERVRLRMRFERYPGLFLYHCHNLEHEDAGMMRNLLIEA